MTDYIAARIDDPLIHSSVLADFVGGLVEGAVVAGILLAAGTGVGAVLGGVAIAALVFSGGLQEIGDAAGKLVDSLIDPGPPDAHIVTGSENVHIKGKKAARAAGTVDRDYLLAPPAPEESIDWAAVGVLALATAAEAAKLILTPGGMTMALAERAKNLTLDDMKKWGSNLWESLSQPLVESADPHATPMPLDTVDCKKGHAVTSSNFIAQGSKSVLINNQPAARNGEKSTCEAEIKVSEDPRVRIGGDTITVRDIRSGKNQLAYLLGGILGSAGVAELPNLARMVCRRMLTRSVLKNIVCAFGSAVVSDTVSSVLITAASTALPVNIASGAKILAKEEDLDFVLADRMPLYWQRIYNSRNRASGMFGPGWMMPFETRLYRLADNQLIFKDMSGRELGLGEVLSGDMISYPDEGLRLFSGPNGAIAIQTGEGDHQVYEPDPTRPGEWRMHRIYDRHENAHYFSWNEQGQLARISSDNEALDVELEYDAHSGRLRAVYQIVDGARQLLVSYRYNDQAQLIAVIDADEVVTRQFGWDRASDMLAWHSFPTGLKVHYQWQASADAGHWRVKAYQVHDEQGTVLENWRIDADESKRYARVSNDEGVVSEHYWDEIYRITAYTDVHGGKWQFSWAGQSEQLLSAVQPDGGRWEYAWDDRGNMTLERDPLERATLKTWHPLYDFPLKEVLPDGGVWQYEYSLAGDVVALTDPEGGVTRFEWNDQGDLIRRIDALENSHRFWWDALGQLIREEDCSGNQSQNQYDGAGRLIRSTDPLGNTDRYVWSPAGRLQTYIRADGRETKFSYTKSGLLCGQSVDGVSTRRVKLNARGQVTEATDPAGHVTRFRFNRAGRLVTLTNANNQEWRFDYTPTGLLTCQQDYAGRQTEYHYNAAQQVATLVRHPERGSDLPAQVLNYEYDALGRMTARETPEHRTEYRYSALATEIRRYAYTEWRQAAVEMREPAHSEAIILARNKLGDLVCEENHSGVYQHEYDALSNLSATTFPDGRELKFLRYGTGHLLEMQLSLSGKTLPVSGYQRDRLHRETHRTMGALELETHYDMAGRITHRRCTDNLRDRLVSERRYQWDRADQIIRRMYTDGAPSTPAEKYRQSLWGYDAAGRMTQSLQPEGEERFWYDAADNRTTPDLQPVWNNLLKRLDGVSREYDGFGRMTVRHDTQRGVTQRFSYDDEHRISRVEIDGDTEFTKAEYRYDALGRRTEKQVWRRHARKPERTQYAWSGLQMVGETSDTHPDAAVQYIYTENSYEPLARVDSHGEHADIFWYHTELNGLPDSVTDSHGDTVWRGASTAWGRSLRESTPVDWDTPQNLRFQGQYLDRETGLHYNTFRYYDPAGGCYTQMDPIGLLGGINLYQYVSNPLNWMDPVGLSGCAIARASDYRHTLGGKPGGIGKGRNIATSNYNIDGITGTADAISGKGSIPGFVDIPDPNNRLFTTTVVSHPRAFDSEAKILEHIGSKITPDAKGTIDLFSELPICKSCQGVIQQFESKYPGVKINIL
ncbi:RHS repeat-associated core domain-containing protein [Kosakonia cowanii]|uniref:RHS repeat-associated core domain-containing protein n=2 Tax=Kosakonia cowanii TaxID=208223 RepID=UPI0023F79692|nr:RHS repeat-associated core domain-containing protein [Kosakonia cowanii]MDF7758323.1 RHS repeat-associated core domain-containing protein [Kosakonia cowanii]